MMLLTVIKFIKLCISISFAIFEQKQVVLKQKHCLRRSYRLFSLCFQTMRRVISTKVNVVLHERRKHNYANDECCKNAGCCYDDYVNGPRSKESLTQSGRSSLETLGSSTSMMLAFPFPRFRSRLFCSKVTSRFHNDSLLF